MGKILCAAIIAVGVAFVCEIAVAWLRRGESENGQYRDGWTDFN